MVHPMKLQDLKQNFIGQFLPKSKLQPSSASPNIEDRYRTEAPQQKKPTNAAKRNALTVAKSAAVQTSQREGKAVKTSQPLKPRIPVAPKVTKTQSVPKPDLPILMKVPVPVSKSAISKPSVDKSKLKPRKVATAKPSAATNPVRKVPATNSKVMQAPAVAKNEHASSLPLGDSYMKPRPTPKVSKMSKPTNKNSLKPGRKFPAKDSEVKADRTNEKTVLSSVDKTKKKTLYSPKKTADQRRDEPVDGTKEAKKLGKYKLSSKVAKNTKGIVKTSSPNSISDFSVKEIKHTDSFIISTRKLQNLSGARKALKPEFLKLFKRPTHTQSSVTTDMNQLKSCMKKSDWGESGLGSMEKYVENSIPNLNFGLHKPFGKNLLK